MMRTVRRNKLIGMWAAEELGLLGEGTDTYSNDLCVGTLDFERNHVRAKFRERGFGSGFQIATRSTIRPERQSRP